MKIEIKVPAMGESISEATVAALLKPSGSFVESEAEMIELETEKVNQILYAPEKGRIDWSVKEHDTVKIGQLLGTLDTEAAPETGPAPAKVEREKPKKTAEKEEPKKEKLEKTAEQVYAPSADKPAIPTSEPKGSARTTKEDFITGLKPEIPKTTVPAPSEKPSPTPTKGSERESRKKISRIRSVIASRMVEVLQHTAMLTTFNEADMTQIISLRETFKETFQKQHNVRLGYMSFFIKAVVSGLKAFPNMQAYLEGEEVVTRHYFDISVAVGTDRGVITPVIRNCEALSFAEIERALESFAKKAREGGLQPSELQGGGFTITNGGVYGFLLSTPILNPPQCAILGMHKIQKRPVVVDDQIAIRQMMYLALSYDHRIVDGKEAVSFLVHIKNCLEEPSRLLIGVS